MTFENLVLAQNCDVHVLVLKKLVNIKIFDQVIVPEDVRAFARNYFKQKKELLFLKSNGYSARGTLLRNGYYMNGPA